MICAYLAQDLARRSQRPPDVHASFARERSSKAGRQLIELLSRQGEVVAAIADNLQRSNWEIDTDLSAAGRHANRKAAHNTRPDNILKTIRRHGTYPPAAITHIVNGDV